jgi:hypothetical protein
MIDEMELEEHRSRHIICSEYAPQQSILHDTKEKEQRRLTKGHPRGRTVPSALLPLAVIGGHELKVSCWRDINLRRCVMYLNSIDLNLERKMDAGHIGRILVVDDDMDVRRSVRSILSKAGYNVDEAEDPEAGVALVKSGANQLPLDAILRDLDTPKFNETVVIVIGESRSTWHNTHLHVYVCWTIHIAMWE